MHIETLGYPADIALPAYNDGGQYLRLSLSGCPAGAYIRFANTTVATDASFDNMIISQLTPATGTMYIQNTVGTDETFGFDVSTSPFQLAIGFTTSPSNGHAQFDVEIETGLGTGIFMPIEDVAGVSVVVVGTPYFTVGALPTAFWTDYLKLVEYL